MGKQITLENTPVFEKVYVNGQQTESYSLVGATLTLDQMPSGDSIVTVETNNFLPSPQQRWCTQRLKLIPFKKWVGEWFTWSGDRI